MRALYLILATLLFSTFAAGQSQTDKDIQIDSRLLEVYDASYLEKLKTTQPTTIQRWNFYLDNAFYIADYPKDKGAANFPEINIPDLSDINIFQLEAAFGMVRDFNKEMIYKIAGTDMVLVYYSGKRFTEKLNEHLGRSNSRNR